MDHLQLTPDTAAHLSTLLRRTSPPSPPSLPPDSRTAAALARAAVGWSDIHRRAESSLQDHLHDVARFLHRVADLDRNLLR